MTPAFSDATLIKYSQNFPTRLAPCTTHVAAHRVEDRGTTGQIIAIQASTGGVPFYRKPGNKRRLV